MKSLTLKEIGQNPILLDMPAPVVCDDLVKIEIAACGLNFADLLIIRGSYQEIPPVPFTMGLEFSGRVVDIGPNVTRFAIGDRVAAFTGQGGLAEFAAASERQCIAIPNSIEDVQAAGLLVAYGTSHLALWHRAKLTKGETLFVSGAAGGVGQTAVEIGKAMGAKVIGCARGDTKLQAVLDAGADLAFDSEDPDLLAKLKSAGGLDVVYDAVGGNIFKTAMRACKPEARIMCIGFASGDVPEIPANILLVKNLTVQGVYWGATQAYAPAVFNESLALVFDMIADGRLTPQIHHVFAFEDALDGLDLLRSRKSTGKVVIQVKPT